MDVPASFFAELARFGSLRLSAERGNNLMKTQKGFTMIEIMIVMAVIAIVVAISAPTWLRQRETSRGRSCQENLTKISGAVEIYATEFKLSNGATVNFNDLIQPNGAVLGAGYLHSIPDCGSGGIYSVTKVGDAPLCSIGTGVTVGFPPHVLP